MSRYFPWLGSYIRVRSVTPRRGDLEIKFENGDVVSMSKSALLTAGNNTRWSGVRVLFRGHAIVVPDKPHNQVIDPKFIRFHTDPKFRRYWQAKLRREGRSWREEMAESTI